MWVIFLLRGYRAYKFRPEAKLSHPKNRLTFREAVGGSLVDKEKNLAAAAGLWPGDSPQAEIYKHAR